MGQQQLLLLVLGIVIVGLAVVVGIEAFSQNKLNSTVDMMVNDIVGMGSQAQAWSLKPQAFGGPVQGKGFEGVTLQTLGYATQVVEGTPVHVTQVGSYGITGAPTTECIAFRGYSNDAISGGTIDPDLAAVVSLVVTGAHPDSIRTETGTAALTFDCND